MNKNNLLRFTVGAAITGISAYYAFKNKDEIKVILEQHLNLTKSKRSVI